MSTPNVNAAPVTAATGNTAQWQVVQQKERPDPEPATGMFEVEVHGLHRIDLIPKNDLARSLLDTMLHGGVCFELRSRGRTPEAEPLVPHYMDHRVERAILRFSYGPGFSGEKSARPFWTTRKLNDDQVAKVKAALDAPKQADAPKKRPRRKA